MTTQDNIYKWTMYGLALVLTALVDSLLLVRLTILGVHPTLLPVAAACVGVLEGQAGGAGFGLACGVLAVFGVWGETPLFLFALSLAGFLSGTVSAFLLRRGFLSALLCAAGTLLAVDLFRVGWFHFHLGAAYSDLFRVAGAEILVSLLFAPLVYRLFFLVFRWAGRFR
ncbi:MAG TPA: rod shape-determining protein MreD [Oscillospiraceae bacterium]|nr:rod shape-determining protein MreD [Oscillospiraceae bacterium]